MASRRFNVRRAVPGDESVLRRLRLEALTSDPQAFSSTYERELARTTANWQRWMSRGITLILEEGGQARGLVSGMYDAEQAGAVYLMAMWVHPDLRGTGAADALVNEHLKWAHSVGAKVVRLGVIGTNVRARRFYERHGFRLTGRETIWEADGRVELQMERAVSSTE